MKVAKKMLRDVLGGGIDARESSNYWRLRNELIAKVNLGKMDIDDSIKVGDLIQELDKADAHWERVASEYMFGGVGNEESKM